MSLFYEQQLTTGSLATWPHKQPIGIDAMGKLVPAVLKVGHLVNRGKEATSHYAEIHRWIKWLLSFGVSLLFVFDGLARYPPKAARAHKERAEREKQERAQAVQFDARPVRLQLLSTALYHRFFFRRHTHCIDDCGW